MYPPDDDSESSSYDAPSREFYVGPRKSRLGMFGERYLPITEFATGALAQFGFFVTWIWAILHAMALGGVVAIFLTIVLPGASQAYWAYKTFGSPFSFVCIGVAALMLLSWIMSRMAVARRRHI